MPLRMLVFLRLIAERLIDGSIDRQYLFATEVFGSAKTRLLAVYRPFEAKKQIMERSRIEVI